MPTWVDHLYLAHTLLELFLGLIKLRGRYQHEAPGSKAPRSEMYTRHHGCTILALALLGFFVWYDSATDTRHGTQSSAVLALFHGGATLSFLYAYLHGAIPFGKVCMPHGPFAIAFLAHAVM